MHPAKIASFLTLDTRRAEQARPPSRALHLPLRCFSDCQTPQPATAPRQHDDVYLRLTYATVADKIADFSIQQAVWVGRYESSTAGKHPVRCCDY